MTTAPALPTWTIDAVHSSVEFSVAYMGFSTYRTGFRALEGTVVFDPARPERGSVAATIPAGSIDVTNERLLGRLMDADLLGGRDHPTISFRSTRVEPVDAAHWKVAGDLTLHGVTRPVVLDTRFLGQATGPFNKRMTAAFRAETELDRREFGVSWNAVVDTGAVYVGERVQISLLIVAVRQE